MGKGAAACPSAQSKEEETVKREDIEHNAVYAVYTRSSAADEPMGLLGNYYGNSLLSPLMKHILESDEVFIEKVNKHEAWASELENGVRKPQKG
jgi:hypothetical protein